MRDIFMVRVNIDDLRRKCGLCLRAEDKAALLDGFMYAVSGGEPQADMPPRWQDGYTVGSEAHARAKEHQSRMSELGQRSANVRTNACSNVRSNARSNARSNQANKPTSQQASKPESDKPAAPRPPTEPGLFDPVPEQPPPPPGPKPAHMAKFDAAFAHGDVLSVVRGFMGKMTRDNGNLDQWRQLIEEHGAEALTTAAKKVRPDERWPDKVAAAIWNKDQLVCPYPAGTDKAMNWWALNMDLK